MILKAGIELYHASYTVVDKIVLSLCSSAKILAKAFMLPQIIIKLAVLCELPSEKL